MTPHSPHLQPHLIERCVVRMKKMNVVLAVLSAFFVDAYAQDGSFLNRFGYSISLQNVNRFDSNVLRLSSPTSDLALGLYPAVTIRYLIQQPTVVEAGYVFGWDSYTASKFLSTNSHHFFMAVIHSLKPGLGITLLGSLVHSNQPDVLNQRSLYSIASFDQFREGIGMRMAVSTSTLLSLEYSIYQRMYDRLFVSVQDKQRNWQQRLGLQVFHVFSQGTMGGANVGLIVDNSNNPAYKYVEPFLRIYFSHSIGGGFRMQLSDEIGGLLFSNRPVSNNIARSRRDLINSLSIGLEKPISPYLVIYGRYYLQRDFSNEPLRNFIDHSVNFGFRISFDKAVDIHGSNGTSSSFDDLSGNEVSPVNKAAVTMTNLGYEYLTKRLYEQSLAYSLTAISLDSTIAQAHINAGIAYYKKGDLGKAIAQWKIALSQDPHNAKLADLVQKAVHEKGAANSDH